MKIDYLANHLDAIPTLARWFHEEWGYLHPGRTLNDVKRQIMERTKTNAIPITLVAYDGEELLGTICLKLHDMETRMDLKPWLACLYVSSSKRSQGIGTALVSAIENTAHEIGEKKLYLFTPQSESFYLNLGWQTKEKTEYNSCAVTIMEKQLFYSNDNR